MKSQIKYQDSMSLLTIYRLNYQIKMRKLNNTDSIMMNLNIYPI